MKKQALSLLLALSLLFAALTVAMTLYLPILIGQAVDLIVAPGKVEFSSQGEQRGQLCPRQNLCRPVLRSAGGPYLL